MLAIAEALRTARTELGFDPSTVAEAAGIDTPSLIKYESGEQQLPGAVLWRLSDVLGVPFEEIDSPATLEHYVKVMAVRFKSDKKAVPESVRLATARAAVVARQYVELEELAEYPSRYEQIVKAYPAVPQPPRTNTWKAGRELGMNVRDRLGIKGRIESMLNLVRSQFGILVLWQRLPVHVAGYALCDDLHGPTLVLNVNGRNANELVRRFTLAHEACHVLFDRNQMQLISSFDTYENFFSLDDAKDPHEIRANAFAIHFLAPQAEFENEWRATHDVRRLMVRFGISYEVTRIHLNNLGLFPLAQKMDRVATTAPDELKTAESAELWYPAFDVIPIERRHSVAPLAFTLWHKGVISISRLREVLDVRVPYEELRQLSELYIDAIAA
jgi:Zn-dependent peptidase ImmA (M78 family)/transcriptional regulator with XRE-family HTH domain